MSDHDAEMDAIVAELEAAGLVESYVAEDDKPAPCLSETCAQRGRALALTPIPRRC